MVQAAFLNSFSFDPFPCLPNGVIAPAINIGRRDVADGLMIASVVVMIDESGDLGLKIAGHKVMLQQNPVLESLMPALDLSLRLRMHGSPGHAQYHASPAITPDLLRHRTARYQTAGGGGDAR